DPDLRLGGRLRGNHGVERRVDGGRECSMFGRHAARLAAGAAPRRRSHGPAGPGRSSVRRPAPARPRPARVRVLRPCRRPPARRSLGPRTRDEEIHVATGEDGEQHAAVHETHVGVVLLLGDRAYKLKKPVRTSFLDFGTPERRLAALRRELALNRRLAPDVYLGLSRLSAPSATGEPGDDGGAEPLLVMRRMPAARRLSTLVRRGADVDASLRALARLMAAFHARAERGPRIALEGDREALRARWLANTEELRRHEPDLFPAGSADDVGRLVTRCLAGRGPLFAERLADDRMVDGHGDLIAGDVFCLDDGPRVLDCLEFDDHLRFVDALDDVAFLAMDLERLGRPDLGERFLDLYVAFSGDRAPASLRLHYTA